MATGYESAAFKTRNGQHLKFFKRIMGRNAKQRGENMVFTRKSKKPLANYISISGAKELTT
jgi:hypothetical protein